MSSLKKTKKKLTQFTARDVHQFWCDQYQKERKEEYSTPVFVGHELHLLKNCLLEHDIYSILVAILEAVKTREYSIQTFCDHLDSYLPRGNAQIHFLVQTKGGEIERKKLQELNILNASWMGSAENSKRKKVLIQELKDWVDATI